MNRFDRRMAAGDEAKLQYLDGDFKVLQPGSHVRCAVTGIAIPIEELRYWNVDAQEPYASPQAKLARLGISGPAPAPAAGLAAG